MWASSWSRCNRSAVRSDHARRSPETLPHKRRQKRGLRQTLAAPPTSALWRAAHIGEWRAVAGAGAIREQVASKWSEWATCRSYYSCCTVLLYCSLLHYNLLYLDFWVLGWAYFWMGWAYFRERWFLKIRPPPSLSSHLGSLPMGIFSRAYSNIIYSPE